MKAASLVLDFDLYPRPAVDSRNVTDLVEALVAGAILPAILICAKTLRVVDGFHRVRAHLRAFGPDAMIDVVKRTFKTEADLFAEAIRTNGAHGKRLNQYDRVRCVTIARRLRIPDEMVASCLHLTPSKLADLVKDRTAKNGRETIALKQTIRHKAGAKLTKRQVDANRKLSGMGQSFYVNQVIELIEADLVDTENEKLMARLTVLHGLLEPVVAAGVN